MAASNERAYLQLKITEYLTRAEELKTALYMDKRNNETMQRNWASQDRYVTKDADSLKRGLSKLNYLPLHVGNRYSLSKNV